MPGQRVDKKDAFVLGRVVLQQTFNAQRTILKIFYGNLRGAGTREALCVTCISELDVERWTLNVGRLEVPYLISITSMSTRLRQGFGVASEQKQR